MAKLSQYILCKYGDSSINGCIMGYQAKSHADFLRKVYADDNNRFWLEYQGVVKNFKWHDSFVQYPVLDGFGTKIEEIPLKRYSAYSSNGKGMFEVIDCKDAHLTDIFRGNYVWQELFNTFKLLPDIYRPEDIEWVVDRESHIKVSFENALKSKNMRFNLVIYGKNFILYPEPVIMSNGIIKRFTYNLVRKDVDAYTEEKNIPLF